MKDIVFSEAEYSILMKRINEYSAFLSNSIKKYREILDYLMDEAIHDDLIRAKILQLKSDVSMYTDQLESVRTETAKLMVKLSGDIEKADKIILPDTELSHIQSLLNIFK